MEITEKVAYLKGLAEGLELDTSTKEGKLISSMIDILDDMALEFEDLKDEQAELGDGLDAVSDDLEDVEHVVYGVDEDEDDNAEDKDKEDEDEDCYATTCPNCGETVYFDESVLEDGGVTCPKCGEKLEFDASDLTEDSGDDNQPEE